MKQSPEAKAFLKRVISLPRGPGVSLDHVLQPCLDDEAELRKLFAIDKTNVRLKDPFVGLVDVFAAPSAIRTTRARIVKDDVELSRKYVMPLSAANRRKEGSPSMVETIEDFKKNWSIFTEGSLSQLFDWSNVIAAGGSVLACLTPLPETAKGSMKSMKKFYHSDTYPTSDVDLFLWGMEAKQAEKKINSIYEAVRDSIPWDVTCVRTKHAISIHSQYPYRPVQIILRLYSSPAEVMAGFDIDAPCCLYDGKRVYANPRAIVAMMRQCNTIDLTRRSPSYEVRLAKYSSRSYEVYVPTLKREQIDPTIYERSIARIEGLARMLVLERIANADDRYAFLESRRTLRGRPDPLNHYQRRKRKKRGDLKAEDPIGEMSNYDVTTLHIPYGPGWDARKIEKLVYQTDLTLNSKFNLRNKDRRLHRHPAFFGTMTECLEDCCEYCPSPVGVEEHIQQEKENKQYIQGRISFIEEDPGRQSISGSFHPIDIGEWSSQVYIGETQHLFNAIAVHDEQTVFMLIKNGVDVNCRDHVGRTPLHLAILSKAEEIARILIDAGARMSARLVDGRNSLHLAAQLDQPSVIQKLLERSGINKKQAEAANAKALIRKSMEKPAKREPSEDDWSSVEDEAIMNLGASDLKESMENSTGGEGAKSCIDSDYPAVTTNIDYFPEDNYQPDILDVNLPDWDLGFTPLAHAVMQGSLRVVEQLLIADADPNIINSKRDTAFQPLKLTILREDENEASKILERLIAAGATSSTRDHNDRTIFHLAVIENKPKLVSSILRCDPNAQNVLNYPSSQYSTIFPLVSAIQHSNYAIVALLLAYGAKFVFAPREFTLSRETNLNGTHLPVEIAIAGYNPIAPLLIAIGADVDIGCKDARRNPEHPLNRKTIIDGVDSTIRTIDSKMRANWERIAALSTHGAPPQELSKRGSTKTWATFIAGEEKRKSCGNLSTEQYRSRQDKNRKLEEISNYLRDVKDILISNDAGSWDELYPNIPAAIERAGSENHPANIYLDHSSAYCVKLTQWSYTTYDTEATYDRLFEACFAGDNNTVLELCLPANNYQTPKPLGIYVQGSRRTESRQSGYTPLYAAVGGRQWATAKLILAIAAAQYHPREGKKLITAEGTKLGTISGRLSFPSLQHMGNESEGESDNDSFYDSDEANIASEGKVFSLMDIANRASAIHFDVHPTWLFEVTTEWTVQEKDGTFKILSGNLLQKSVYDDDIETFVNILDLYGASPVFVKPGQEIVETIMKVDNPDILHELISRTGTGVNIECIRMTGDKDMPAAHHSDEFYAGLSVHGKKRIDLARADDPNSNGLPTPAHPLLWTACLQKAEKIIVYLSGNRPLEAYHLYASNNDDELAILLRHTEDLRKLLPQWLGWTMTPLGESPFTAAVLSGDVGILKKLFTIRPRFMASSLHQRVKFIGYNTLMLAVEVGADPTMISYLMEKSVSPSETDKVRGWNIYHILCKKNNCDLLAHFLMKLPRDLTEAMLSQQTKDTLDTPLHLTVKYESTGAAKLIVAFTATTLMVRNIDGSTPLHIAVEKGYPEITSLLLTARPSVMYMENGVGETLLEIATSKDMFERTRRFVDQRETTPPSLPIQYFSEGPKPINAELMGTELSRLRAVLQEMLDLGRLTKGTLLGKELFQFADMLESEIYGVRGEKTTRQGDRSTHLTARAQVLRLVSNAFSAAPGHRKLVPLIDAQRSVHGNLARLSGKTAIKIKREDDGGLKPEVEVDELKGSLVLQEIGIQPYGRHSHWDIIRP